MRGQRRGSLAAGLVFERAQDLFGSRQKRGWQAGQTRHFDAVRSIGSAGKQLVQKDNLVLVLTDRDLGIADAWTGGGERGQLVIVRREQRPAAADLVQVLDRGPRERGSRVFRGR